MRFRYSGFSKEAVISFSKEAAASITCPESEPGMWGAVRGHTRVSVTIVPVWAAENIVRKKKEFIVHAVSRGTAKVMACSEAEALDLANSLRMTCSTGKASWKLLRLRNLNHTFDKKETGNGQCH